MTRARILGLGVVLAIAFGATSSRGSTPSQIFFSGDRVPVVSAKIYRLDPNGRRVNLSRGPDAASRYGDAQPLVSPDGKEVAFIGDRSAPNEWGIYEVGIDGRHLRNVAPFLEAGPDPGQLAWQPHGDRLAAIAAPRGVSSALWILRRGHKPQRVAGKAGYSAREPSWSPDGSVLLVWIGGWRAFSPAGRRLWVKENAAGCCSGGTSWSPHGLLAITTQRRLAVYDEGGHKRFDARAPAGRVGPPSWSPGGREVSFAAGRTLEVRTADGRLVLRKRVPRLDPHQENSVVWVGDRRLVAGLPTTGPQEGVDVHTGKLWSASNRWFDPRSPNGKLMIVTPQAGSNFTIGVAPVGGGPTRSYGSFTGCGAASLQFVGRTRSLVYASGCGDPTPVLYSMAPDGTGLHEISGIQPSATEAEVSLSPDGAEIAYTFSQSCCTFGIGVANVDGTGGRALVNPPPECKNVPSIYAPSWSVGAVGPTWSPDGKTILFSEGMCDKGPELYTVSAAGGEPHDLGVAGSEPAWGPSRIAYVAGGLMTANPDGGDPVEVATFGVSPAWSSDGRLAYVGSTQLKLPFATVDSLSWSPDGTRFVVTAQKTPISPFEVYTVRTDGTDPIQLTTNYDAGGATWR